MMRYLRLLTQEALFPLRAVSPKINSAFMRVPTIAHYCLSSSSEGEAKIKQILEKSFPSAKKILVEDISGGCGSMYQVYVESQDFNGVSIVKQHQLVNKALHEEIKAMHGIRISTKGSKS